MDSSFIGKVVDHYRIIENLGIGGMGVVFKAINININKLVALKMIAPGLAMNPNFIKRFQTEAKALAKLNDFNIVGITDLRKDNDQWFIVMEYVDGVNLFDKIKRDGAYSCSESIPIIKQILRAIGHAHKAGIIHRDLKPNNIMVTKDGVVKITDFGLAKDQSLGSSVVSIASGGTLYYMSPEHVKGFSFTDHRSDLYSIGMTYYEMITGKVPFQNINSDFDLRERIIRKNFEKPSFYNPKIPPGLEAIIMKSIAKDPDMRYQTADEMLAAIERFEKTYETGKFPRVGGQRGAETQADSTLADTDSKADVRPKHGKYWWIGIAALLLLILLLFFPGRLNHQAQLLKPEKATADSLVQARADSQHTEKVPQTVSSQEKQPVRKKVTPIVKSARLSIQSVPVEARVRINGQFKGVTPLRLAKLPAGRYTVEVSKKGYRPSIRRIELSAGKNLRQTVQLTALPGKLRLTNLPGGASVLLNGEELSPDQMSALQPGLYNLSVQKNGYEPFGQKVQIEPGKETVMDINLLPIQVVLAVRVIPWGSIYIDDQLKQADSDLEYRINLPAGSHTLRVVHPSLGVWQKNLEFVKSGTEVVKVDFSETRALRIKARDENGNALAASIYVDGQKTGHRTPDPVLVRVGLRKIRVQLDGYKLVSGEKEVMIDDRFNGELAFVLQKQ